MKQKQNSLHEADTDSFKTQTNMDSCHEYLN